MTAPRPPRWLEGIVAWAAPSGLSGQSLLGDLEEDFKRRAASSLTGARLWYALQAVSLVGYAVLSVGSARDSWLIQDIRWTLRSLARHPGFSLGVVAVLGLGLGANVAVFSVVDGTLRNTSWWDEPDRTVAIWPDNLFSFGQLEMYADEQDAYRTVGGYVEAAFALGTPDGESQSVNGVMMTPALFRELAVQPALGRALADEDAFFGVEPVVVLSESLWRRSFGADPGVLGSRVDVGGGSATVVGIQGAGGKAPGGRADLWLPLVMDPRDDDYWKAQSHTMVGVLRDDADMDRAYDDLMAFTNTLSSLFPMFFPEGFAEGFATVTRADEAQRRLIATPLLLLLAGTGLLLLVTALNVGNLLLGRAIDRRKELAVRVAIGAGRGRIVRQLLTEGVVFSAVALGVGLVTGSVGGRWIARLFVEEPTVARSSVATPSVLLFLLAASVLSWGILNGVPIVHFLRTQRRRLAFQPDSGAALQRGMVTVQAALATLLLVSATLLVGTVENLRRVPLGFDERDIMTVELSPPADRVASAPVARELYTRLVDRLASTPGVSAAGLTGWLPLRVDAPPTPINLQSAPVDPREALRAPMHKVDAGFFDVFGVRPVEGRLLGSEDRAVDAPSAVVVNETLARMLWPEGSAVGQRIAIDPHAWDSWAPVVGVVPDIRSGDITGPMGPALYVSLAESPARDVTLVLRTSESGAVNADLLRQAVREVDPLVPIRAVSAMVDVVRAAYATSWVMMGLLIILAALSTGLGAIGIYAVLAHHVSLNRREIGVRMALGAQPGVVIGGVVRTGLTLAGLGILVGSGAAALSTRFLESMLFGVSALAPWAFVAPALGLAAAAVLAAWIPAAKAGRLPPAEVLRSE